VNACETALAIAREISMMRAQEYNNMTIKAIFFDFDDTLGYREMYAYDCYRRIIMENAPHLTDPFELEAVVQNCMLWDEKGNVDKTHVKDMLRKTHGIELPYEDLNKYWDQILWEHCVPYEDSERTLTELAKRYKLGLITNGPSDGQRNKLAHSGLSRFFNPEEIVVSGDYPFSKPDPRIFWAGCEKLGVKPEEAVYVGDIYGRDILGAHRAGMTPVWIWNWGNRKCATDILVIHHISELLDHF
jgi:putative hydrolase of the HAD superfamily